MAQKRGEKKFSEARSAIRVRQVHYTYLTVQINEIMFEPFVIFAPNGPLGHNVPSTPTLTEATLGYHMHANAAHMHITQLQLLFFFSFKFH